MEEPCIIPEEPWVSSDTQLFCRWSGVIPRRWEGVGRALSWERVDLVYRACLPWCTCLPWANGFAFLTPYYLHL